MYHKIKMALALAIGLAIGLVICHVTRQVPQNQADADSSLAIGTIYSNENGLSVVVNSVEYLTDKDSNEITCIHVTYTNDGNDDVNYNLYDWEGKDVNEDSKDFAIYLDQVDALQSGTLAANDTVSGNIYFEGSIVKIMYYAEFLDKSPVASWKL